MNYITSDLVSGNLYNQPDVVNGPFLCVVGTASSGPSYVLKRVQDFTADAVDVFESGSTDPNTDFMKDIALAMEANPENINLYVMRIGGKSTTMVLQAYDSAGNNAQANATISITPAYKDAEILQEYNIIMCAKTSGTGQRIVIHEEKNDVIVYDSEEILIPSVGIMHVEIGSWFDTNYFEVGLTQGEIRFGQSGVPTLEDLQANPTLYAGSNMFGNGAEILMAPTSLQIAGSDGSNLSRPEKYAALTRAYKLIATRYMDMIVPSGVFVDDPNITDTEDGSDPAYASSVAVYDKANIDWSSVPTAGSSDDLLGYAWHFDYKARTYTMMATDKDLWTTDTIVAPVADLAAGNFTYNDTLNQGAVGLKFKVNFAPMAKLMTYTTGGSTYKVNKIEVILKNSVYEFDGVTPHQYQTVSNLGDACLHVEESFNTSTKLLTVYAAFKLTGNTTKISLEKIQEALEAVTYIDSVEFFLNTTGASHTLLATNYVATYFSAEVGATTGELSVGKYWLSHSELMQEEIPSRVWDKFLNEGSASQMREVNFAHQLAQFCYEASRSYHMCLGFMSTSSPDFSQQSPIASHLGDAPVYQGWNGQLRNTAIRTPGEGVLSNKFLSGAKGYRWQMLKGATSSAGLAYGGFICTKGAALPNGRPYGIDSSDEKKDRNKAPVDIGRHLVLSAVWPVFTLQIEQGSARASRHYASAAIAAKIFGMPVNIEPFGQFNGELVNRMAFYNEYHEIESYSESLKNARLSSINTFNGLNYITSISTAAHPDDDYKRISTIRCVNRVVNGLRNLAMRYIGRDFSSSTITSLQTAINGYLKSEQSVGTHQGAVATLSYSRTDRINGNLKIILKMVPPFAIEAITIETSLQDNLNPNSVQ